MLLFSTILEIDKKLTKDDFINLVIEWNQKGHPESVISGLGVLLLENRLSNHLTVRCSFMRYDFIT